MIISRLGIKMFSSSLQAWLGLEFGLNYTIESVDPRDRIKRKQKNTTRLCIVLRKFKMPNNINWVNMTQNHHREGPDTVRIKLSTHESKSSWISLGIVPQICHKVTCTPRYFHRSDASSSWVVEIQGRKLRSEGNHKYAGCCLGGGLGPTEESYSLSTCGATTAFFYCILHQRRLL